MFNRTMSSFLITAETIVLFGFFFLFPLIFSPSFLNAFATTKFFFLALVVGLLLLIKAVRIIFGKELILFKSSIDMPLYLLIFGFLLSVVFISPNKVAALIDPNRGALIPLFFILALFLLPKDKKIMFYASLSALLLLLIGLTLSYFSLLKFLPDQLAFLNKKSFTFMGDMLDFVFYSGFFLALSLEGLGRMGKKTAEIVKWEKTILNITFLISFPAFVFSLFVLFTQANLSLGTLDTAWQVAAEGIKNIKTFFLGVGPANYLSLFTQGKPVLFNNTPQWQFNLTTSRSALLSIFSETGVFGTIAIFLIVIYLLRRARQLQTVLPLIVFIVWLLFFPITINFYFLLFIILFLFRVETRVKEINFKDIEVANYGFAGFIIVIVLVSGYFLRAILLSEYYFGQSLVAAKENKAQVVYDLQRKAIEQNRFNETMRVSFSQTNLLLANSLGQKEDLNEQEKKTIATLIQQGINEARAVVSLNPTKAVHWANLANTYRQLLGFAQGADAWAISSYQRAIALDQYNPNYFFNLGAVYFALSSYDEAIRLFQQAVSLKPDVANFHYNLAWAYAQQEDYKNSVNAMEAVLRLLDPKSDDYKTAKRDYENWKSQIPEESVSATEGENLQPETLTPPSTAPSMQPNSGIKLPENNF